MAFALSVARSASAATIVGLTIVPRVASTPAQWTLVEELRIGAAETEATTFTDVRGVAVGTNGQIFVLEFRTQEIRAFDANGKFIKNIARKGAGPGEIASANGLVVGPNGTIWANDPANSRFSTFRSDGSFLRQYIVPITGYGFLWEGTIDAQGRIIEPVFTPRGSSVQEVVRRFSPGDAKTDTLQFPCGNATRERVWEARSKNGGTVMSVPFTARPLRRMDARGFVWCSPGESYRIVKARLGGTDTASVIDRKVPAVPVPKAERDAEVARIDSILKRYESANVDYSQIPTVRPAITDLNVDDAGRLWVRRSTNETSTTLFDIFDDAGKLVATTRAPFKVHGFSRPLIRGDAMYAVVVDDDGVQNVVRARIRK
jgi:hypothetical protein